MPFYGTPTSNFQQYSVACLPAALQPACLPVCLLARRGRERPGGSRQGGRSASPPPPPSSKNSQWPTRAERGNTALELSPHREPGRGAQFPQLQMNIKVDEIGFYDVDEWVKVPNFGKQGRKKDSISFIYVVTFTKTGYMNKRGASFPLLTKLRKS